MSRTKKRKGLWVLLIGGCGIVLCLAVVSSFVLMVGRGAAPEMITPSPMVREAAPIEEPEEEPEPTIALTVPPVGALEPTKAPAATMVATSPPGTAIAPTLPPPSPTPEALHQRLVEVEWPPRMRLGDSDVIRLSFIPSPEGGYIPTVEFEEHKVEITAVPIPAERFERYYVYASADLHAIGFDVEPGEFPPQEVLIDQSTSWRWSIEPRQAGEHRVNLSLALHWEPRETTPEARVSEQLVWSDSLSITAVTCSVTGAIPVHFRITAGSEDNGTGRKCLDPAIFHIHGNQALRTASIN